MTDLLIYKDTYRKELTGNIIPFWERHSPDREYGGYFTCLDRRGNVFDSDKFMWLQGRQVWFFSMIYNEIEKKQEWLDMALLGARFMQEYGTDPQSGNWYFSLTRQGKPLMQPYNIFSDCFAAMAFGELYKATGNEEYKETAFSTFRSIRERSADPKGVYNKSYPGTRPMKSFALPMIMCNLSLIMEEIIGTPAVDKMIHSLTDEIIHTFCQEDSGLILENVAPDGSFINCFEGRLVSPGHTNEAAWFMMDIAHRYQNRELADKSVDILLKSLEFGWDKQHQGIFYFRDIRNHPVLQLEWDQKLWWVHIESMIACLKGFCLTGNEQCKEWFLKLHQYTWTHFRDPEYPEWYGYLTRKGDPLLSLKGGKWKGCFHVPRGLFQLWKTLENKDRYKIRKHKKVLDPA